MGRAFYRQVQQTLHPTPTSVFTRRLGRPHHKRVAGVRLQAYLLGDYVPQHYADIAGVNTAIVQDLQKFRGSSAQGSKFTTPEEQLLRSLRAAQRQVEAAERFVLAGRNSDALAVLKLGALGLVKNEAVQGNSGLLETVESNAVQRAETEAFGRMATKAATQVASVGPAAFEILESSAIDLLESGALDSLKKRLAIGPALYRLLPAEEVKITLQEMKVAEEALQVNASKGVCLEELRELADQLGSLALLVEYGRP